MEETGPGEAMVMRAPAVAVGRSTYHDSVHVDSYAEQTREEVAERHALECANRW